MPLTVSHPLAMIGDHWSSVSGDIKHLLYHVASQNYVTEGSSNFMANLMVSHHHATMATWIVVVVI